MKFIDHPARFRQGTRVLMLKGRYKDGLEKQRTFLRVSHNEDQFSKAEEELEYLSQEGERIYVTATPRDVDKAARIFKGRQLDAGYAADPMDFYRHLFDRWVSCLMQTEAQTRGQTVWMFDCDNAEEEAAARQLIDMRYRLHEKEGELKQSPYTYASKTAGACHIIVEPFHHGNALGHEPANRLLDKNPLMLWAY